MVAEFKSNQPHTLPVLLLNDEQTISTQTSIIQLTDILYLIQRKLHGTALALGE